MKLLPLLNGMFAQVDDADFDWLSQWKWSAFKTKKDNTYYVKRAIRNKQGKKERISMHRQILGITDKNLFGDHIDHNGLNNQRSNLRIATLSENNSNRKPYGKSKYKGVSMGKSISRDKKSYYPYYRVSIFKNGKSIHLGTFPYTPCGELLAALKYDEKAKELHGEFAYLNFK